MTANLENTASWLQAFAHSVHENAALLTDLDRQIGDADHGSNMDRGMTAVAAIGSADFEDAAAYLKKVGMTLVSTVGGASGPLYGTFFLRFAGAIGDGERAALGAALRAGLEGVVQRGKAEVGDKTLVDALSPAVDAYDAAAQSDSSLAQCLTAAAEACGRGRDATTPLIARKGRASYLGERSKDHQDPGATSMTLLLDAAAATLG
ncbi:dihydroxyacetone kinase subunit DhaL [Calidifontibacter terrae]